MCAPTDTFTWYQLPGSYKQVSIAKGQIFGVNGRNEISYSASTTAGQVNWVPVIGTLAQISFDGNTICGTDNLGQAFCADQHITTNPFWFKVDVIDASVSKKLKQAVVYGNLLFVVTTEDELYFSSSVKEPNWRKVSGNFKQIQFAGDEVCGTTASDQIYCSGLNPSNPKFVTEPNWFLLPGNLKQISNGGTGRLMGVDSNDNIYTGKLRAVNAQISYS
jgi:hypothetical protein